MASRLFDGAGYLIRGFGLITKPGIRPFVLIPLTVNILIFSLLIWLGIGQFEALMDHFLPAEDSWFAWLRWLLWPLFTLAIVVLVFYTFTLIANLLAAPFNGLLAERIERYLGGEMPRQSGGLKPLMGELLPSLLSELRKTGYFLLRAIPLLILFFIPWTSPLAPFLWIVFSAWFLALEYGDYPMANHGLSFKEQRRRLRQTRFTALSFGGSLMLMMSIPLLNFLAMPVAVAGATLFWRERLKEL